MMTLYKKAIARTTAIVAIAIIVIVAILGAVAYWLTLPTPTVKEVLIGEIHPLTGSLAFEGSEMRDACILAVEDINNAGGIKSLGGAKLKLLHGDSAGSPDKGMAEAERLINEGCVALIGCYQSSVTYAATQVAEKEKTPFVVSVAVADDICQRGFKYTFRHQPNAKTMAFYAIKYLAEWRDKYNINIKTLVLAHENTLFGTTIANHEKTFAPNYGFEVIDDVSYSAATADLSTQILRIKAEKPDALIISGYFNDGVLWARQIQELGLKEEVKVIMGCANGAFSHPDFPSKAGLEVTEGIIDVNYHWNPVLPSTAELFSRYYERFGRNMSTHAVLAYDSVLIIADAIERAASTDKTAIRDALAKTDFSGSHMCLAGNIKFDETGENINALPVAMQVQSGKIVVVFPEKFAEAKFVFPQPWVK